jgi:hypothetical protein
MRKHVFSTIAHVLASFDSTSGASLRNKKNELFTSNEWVMGQMGHQNLMGHMGHGSVGVDP